MTASGCQITIYYEGLRDLFLQENTFSHIQVFL